MTGLGEILEENSRLRDFVRERDARLDAQSEQLRVQAALIAELDQKLAAVQASNDQFKRYQEFIEKVPIARRPAESASFQLLVHQGESAVGPHQGLQRVAIPIGEQEQGAVERLLTQRPLADRGQAVDLLAEVDGLTSEENPRGNGDHARASTTRRRSRRSVSPSTSTRTGPTCTHSATAGAGTSSRNVGSSDPASRPSREFHQARVLGLKPFCSA